MEKKFENLILILLIVATYITIIIFLDLKLKESKIAKVDYEILNCSEVENYNNYYFFEEDAKTIIANIVVNCCSDEIKVEKEKDFYIIKEIEENGEICRCVCNRKIKILDAENKKLKFIDYLNNEIVLEESCGISKYSYCNSDKDCVISGCSNEMCANETFISVCIWKDCYENLKNYKCACINNKCQWAKIK